MRNFVYLQIITFKHAHMDNQRIFERFGELVKEEPISTLQKDLVLPDTVVFEAVSPFFGYYNDAPLSDKEPYLYLLLDACYPLSKVARAISSVRKRVNHPLIADPGSVQAGNQTLPVIRIKGIQKYCRVRHLQKYFAEEGILLKSAFRQITNEMVVINLHKFLQLKEVGDGLYLDLEDGNKGYFVIPEYLDWQAFKDLTREVKYDTSILFFDAAQAAVLQNDCVIEMVRIYREHLAVEKLSAIRDRYLKVLSGTAIHKVYTPPLSD